jgi:CubicO group peptidase (beta-lactamase class C family)/beta-glucosidase-like glycosyl hydrolase
MIFITAQINFNYLSFPIYYFSHTKLQNQNEPMFKKVLAGIVLFSSFQLVAQNERSRWVDSLFNTLTPTEKVAQLFMISVSSHATPIQQQAYLDLIKKHPVGSLLITQGSPQSHAQLANKLQSVSRIPLLLAIQADAGVGQVLDSVKIFPHPLQQGAITNDSLIFEMGYEIAKEMKTLGIHLNFAPNADIHYRDGLFPQTLRYFSDDKFIVATKSIWLMKGLQHGGVLACAKHVDNPKKNKHITQQDSSVFFDVNRIDSIGFYPYQQLLRQGIDGLLTSHLDFVLHEKKKQLPAALSELFVNRVVKQQLGYNGLAFCELPYLKKLSRKKREVESAKLAFVVGNDILINPTNVPKTIKALVKLIKRDKVLQAQLEVSVKKILLAKYNAGLAKNKWINTENLIQKLHTPSKRLLMEKMTKSAITVLKNEGTLPIQHLDHQKFASISFGQVENNPFTHALSKYVGFHHTSVTALKDTANLFSKIREEVVIATLFPQSKNFILQIASIVKKLSLRHHVIVVSFGYTDDLKFFAELPVVLAAYTDEPKTQQAAAEVIFGAISSQGTLPVNIASVFPTSSGEKTLTTDRFSFAEPESVKMDLTILTKIKSIMQEAVDAGATPGCHVLVARNGKVVYEQSVGSLAYDTKKPVTDETIYDLASVTKVSATLQTVMFMHERNLIDINKKISVYLPELKESNKKDFTIKDILTHQAGLWPYLSFWTQTVKNGKPLPEYYSYQKNNDYPYSVTDSLFAHKSMKDSLWQWIINAKVRDKIERTPFDYRYSDMGFYMLQHLAEKVLNQPMEDFLQQNFYDPLGATTLGYLPRMRFAESMIAPTENDQLFRKRLLIGYVHDQGAAMHGGVAGHAGLFGNAIDLAKLGQMWLQKGHYGGHQFLKPETLELFTAKQFETSRRGLGWDKPALNEPNGPTSIYASSKTFGHTGFTGTCIWIDPEFDLVYVFLSNRVHPDMTNNKLLNANIRPRIQDVIYQSILNNRGMRIETK